MVTQSNTAESKNSRVVNGGKMKKIQKLRRIMICALVMFVKQATAAQTREQEPIVREPIELPIPQVVIHPFHNMTTAQIVDQINANPQHPAICARVRELVGGEHLQPQERRNYLLHLADTDLLLNRWAFLQNIIAGQANRNDYDPANIPMRAIAYSMVFAIALQQPITVTAFAETPQLFLIIATYDIIPRISEPDHPITNIYYNPHGVEQVRQVAYICTRLGDMQQISITAMHDPQLIIADNQE